MIKELFKTPLYVTGLGLDNKAISKYCLSYYKKNKGRIRSNEGGWQSNDLQLDKHPILRDLFVSIEEHCSIYTKELGIEMANKIDNMWMNINGYKDVNVIHIHPGAMISGVYYVQTPENCGNIQFQNPANDVFQYDWIPEKMNNFNEYNSLEWWMPSKESVMYLFPSWLKHFVKPNLNKKEKRISISFNCL